MKRRLYSILQNCCWVLATELVAVALVSLSGQKPFEIVWVFGILLGLASLVLGPMWAICAGLVNPIGADKYASVARWKRIAFSILGIGTLLISATFWIPSYLNHRTRVANDSWRDWGARQYRTQSVKCPGVIVYIKETNGKIERVRTGLPEGVSFHKRYEVVTNSADELLIRGRGTNVCNRLVGRQDGRWRVYEREGGEIRYLDDSSTVPAPKRNVKPQ